MAGIAPLSNTFLRVRGPGAAKFLNGLVTTRLSPHLTKKKEHTISTIKRTDEYLDAIDTLKNWGAMYEDLRASDPSVRVLRGGVYSMFLNSKGRVVSDCFNYPFPFHTTTKQLSDVCEASPNYLLELGSREASRLLTMLKIHKLSANVKIEKAPELYSYYYYNDRDPEFKNWLANIEQKYFLTRSPDAALESANALIESREVISEPAASSVVGFAIDNRIPGFGLKIVTNTKLESPSLVFSDSFASAFETQVISDSDVKHRRFANGVFETADAPSGATILPFESSLDYNCGLSLNKGCYVGQELTIRTYNLGVIRKRIVPVKFDHDVSEKLASLDLLEVPIERETASADAKPRRGKLGKLMGIDGDLGFLLTAFEDINRDNRYVAVIDGERIGMTARIPDHWPGNAADGH